MHELEHLKAHLTERSLIIGIGNPLRSDDAAGSLLASRIKDKVPYIVYDAESSPENYLGKIIKDNPDNIVVIDAVDFGGRPGEFRVIEAEDIRAANLYSTHNASMELAINYLKTKIKAHIIILGIQPKKVSFGDKLSSEVENALVGLENWFYGTK